MHSPSRAAGSAAHRGYSLVELLIVLVILGLLVSLLLPVVGKARRMTQRAGCASNLRQLGVMTASYCDDHAGSFPPFHLPGGGATFDCAWQMKAYQPEESPRVHFCPASIGKPKLWGDGDANGPLGGNYVFASESSYGWNQHLRGNYAHFYWWWTGPSAKMDQITSASAVFWAVDGTSPRFDYFYSRFVSGNRHGKTAGNPTGFNALFVDGHAEWIPYANYQAFLGSLQWWGGSPSPRYAFRSIETF